jgi:hypothetical protein
MASRLAIAMFIDACGWDVVSARPWWLKQLEHRQAARSVFGFSSACIPAILTGRPPSSNDHWSSFRYSPSTSPFSALRALDLFPPAVVDRGRVRRWISKAIASAYGFTGYFQIYNVPFSALPLFDYAEKKDLFNPGGINSGTSVIDELVERKIPYHRSNWRKSERANLASLGEAVEQGATRFAFLYTAGLDALMHEHSRNSRHVDARLHWYESQLQGVLNAARRKYDDVQVAVFSDHGMATVTRVVDLMPRVERLGLRFGKDYAAIFDSTMVRFWFLSPRAEELIRNALVDGNDGTWVQEEKLKAYGTYWPDHRFGDAIYALEPGVLLSPSHMGRSPMAGMHGYRPEDPDSDSALLASFVPKTPVSEIRDYYGLMIEMATWAQAG